MSILGIRRGVNLGGWLSQCDYSQERLNHFIREEDFARIASWALDHVRIPVDYNVLETAQGIYDGPGFARLDWAVDMCRKYGLKLVLDLHKTAGFSFDLQEKEQGFFESEALQSRFCRLWEELARRYGQTKDMVIFELLNEVTEPRFIDAWNRISNEAIRAIRAIAPESYIFVGSYHHNNAPAVKDLAAPADDRVVYNFHCYDPLQYTHQRAPWVPSLIGIDPIPFEESGATEEYFEQLIAPAVEKAAQHGAQLYCGEYGVIDRVPPADAIKWIRTLNTVLDRHGIARAIWSYRQMDFGISDPCWDDLRSELIKVL